MSRNLRLGCCVAVGIGAAGCDGGATRATETPEVAGQTLRADLQPGPVLSVSADPALRNDQGLLAKTVAVRFCANRGRALNRQAYGHFTNGVWQFKGGCA